MPYVQHGGWCSCSIALEPGCSKFRGELTSWSSSVEPVGVKPTLSYVGGLPFYSPRWAPIYSYLALCLCTVGAQIALVSRRGPLSRSGVGELDPGNLLVQGMILAISLSGVSPGACPILAQSGWHNLPVDRSGVSFGLVYRSLGFLSAGLSYVALSPSGAPGEGYLTEAWPGASGHGRWRNGMVRRGNHHYGEGIQCLWMPPPIVSSGPHERHCPLVREACSLGPWRKIRRNGTLSPARGLSWPARLSGDAAHLERTS